MPKFNIYVQNLEEKEVHLYTVLSSEQVQNHLKDLLENDYTLHIRIEKVKDDINGSTEIQVA